MNIKKYTLKTMCAVLTCTILLSSLLAVNATGAIITETPMDEPVSDESNWTADEGSFEEIEVTYTQSSSYNVAIPKTIELDTSKQAVYSVKVTGDIDANERVHVVPVDGISDTESIDFYMKDQTTDSRKADVVATVTQNKFYWSSEEVTNGYEEANNSVSAPDLTAGTWKGIFQVAINLESDTSHEHNYVDGVCTECGESDPDAEHQHNYVDGKCECGEVDPNHTHNYVDGTCTICGKETDPYETAPEEASGNWNYTLDDTNNIITLNYYTGSETDVIVYANYPVNGKVYKTQLASNLNNNAGSPYMFNAWTSNSGNIKSIIFSSNINTSNITNMSVMFYNCKSLTSLDLSGFDTSNVTIMKETFMGCTSLKSLNISNWNISNLANANNTFDSCSSLTSLDLSNWDTSSLRYAQYTFNKCTNLKEILVSRSKWVISNKCITNGMFNNCGCSKVTYID